LNNEECEVMRKDRSIFKNIENYRIWRNLLESQNNEINCISFTSNSDKEGKKVIAINLAVIRAKRGKKNLRYLVGAAGWGGGWEGGHVIPAVAGGKNTGIAKRGLPAHEKNLSQPLIMCQK